MRLLKYCPVVASLLWPSDAAFRIPSMADFAIQIQRPQQHPLAEDKSTAVSVPDIITATYGSGTSRPKIKILDRYNQTKWSFSQPEIEQPGLSPELRNCLWHGDSGVEVKYLDGGRKVLATFAHTVLIINHTPDEPKKDKTIAWGMCWRDHMSNSHTVEMLPDNMLALATTGQTMDDGIWIFNASIPQKYGDVHPDILQKIRRFPAIHGMVWDQEGQRLWAAGTEKAADGSMGKAYSMVNSYAWIPREERRRNDSDPDGAVQFLKPEPATTRLTPTTRQCFVQMGDTPTGQFWDGAHDMIPIPRQRKIIVTLEFDIYIYDIATNNFTCCDTVADQYLQGFEPVGNRTGWDPKLEEYETVNRTNFKSISLAPDGSTLLYNQAVWQQFQGKWINLLVGGVKMPNIDPSPGTVYCARFFAGAPGWPTAL